MGSSLPPFYFASFWSTVLVYWYFGLCVFNLRTAFELTVWFKCVKNEKWNCPGSFGYLLSAFRFLQEYIWTSDLTLVSSCAPDLILLSFNLIYYFIVTLYFTFNLHAAQELCYALVLKCNKWETSGLVRIYST